MRETASGSLLDLEVCLVAEPGALLSLSDKTSSLVEEMVKWSPYVGNL